MAEVLAEQQEALDPQEEVAGNCRPRPCEIGVGVAPRTAVVAPPVDTHRLLQKDMAEDSGFRISAHPPSSSQPVLDYSFPLMCIVILVF